MSPDREPAPQIVKLSRRTTFRYRSGKIRTFDYVRCLVINYSTGPEPAWTPCTADGREICGYPMEPHCLAEPDCLALYEAAGLTPWWLEVGCNAVT